ncbi:exodeoxyribonuclease V subunit gamma [[Pasteurella] aerogenes]|nr:exodeoxyribonuclease V subunit gamma [[Pasteurella] aerogenes]
MFTVYYSNQLDVQKDILLYLMAQKPLQDPFCAEVILVQSPGMAQWLQWQIAETKGIAANFAFPMPASFIWQQYAENLANVSQQSEFNKDYLRWRLMRLIPEYLVQAEFEPLRHYLAHAPQTEQQKLYALACRIADLFDQYLVYRPDWIAAWETQQDEKITQQINLQQPQLSSQIQQHIAWQGILWRALVAEIKGENPQQPVAHRAELHQQFLHQLAAGKVKNLPERIFVFGISALPKVYLDTLNAISQHCDVHLFFNNGCREYWGDLVDPNYWQKLRQRYRLTHESQQKVRWISEQKFDQVQAQQVELTYDNEILQVGHPLLASWGKLGRDFLHLLTQTESNEIEAYVAQFEPHLLGQVQQQIFHLQPSASQPLHWSEQDRSLSIHSCYSPMREVEALKDYLLHLFNQDRELTPKDIVVMVADIDRYTPYIRAVFGQQRHQPSAQILPFSISDNKLSENDVIISSFLRLLNLKESLFGAEEVLTFLDVPAIRSKFAIELDDLTHIHYWVEHSGIRYGLETQTDNYNAWQAGLERMLLGYAMREENGIWQDSLAFDSTYGLSGQLVGKLAQFIERLSYWQQIIQHSYAVETWRAHLIDMIDGFFSDDREDAETLWYLKDRIAEFAQQIETTHFSAPLDIEVISEVMNTNLQDNPNNLRFLAGKINFCTLLPMRSIPFKVVCLLGMNENDYPRQQVPHSFDLMQYHHLKGDRLRRDDDRYLFLEALLSAQEKLYISYVGRSIIDDSPLEPSVLVSQLLDYLSENLHVGDPSLEQQAWKKRLVKQHPMTAFSPQNFVGNDRTFARQWLPVANKVYCAAQDFIQPLLNTTFHPEIDVAQLVAFVQNPVKYFFEKQLGVYFEQAEKGIIENENFELNQLDKYNINEELLYCDAPQREQFFAKLRIKGVMPRGNFAQIYRDKLSHELRGLQQKVAGYLDQEHQSEPIHLLFDTTQGKVSLLGQLDHLYSMGERWQRVKWRVGKLRDKDMIEHWVYFLLQCATQEKAEDSLFFSKDKRMCFKTVEKTTALQQLQCYVEAFVAAQQQLQPVIMQNIADYLTKRAKTSSETQNMQESAVDFSLVLDFMAKIAEKDPYWKRLYEQMSWTPAQLSSIDEVTINWFSTMLESAQIENYD